MEFEKRDLPTILYIGYHQDENEINFGYKTRLIANDYSGKFETFTHQVTIFEELTFNKKVEEMFDHRADEINLLHSAAQKLTQLLVLINFLEKQFETIEKEVLQNSTKKYEMSKDFFLIVTCFESVLFLNISILDLMSRFYSEFVNKLFLGSRRIPEKYGQQKAWNSQKNEFNFTFDHDLQSRQKDNDIINACHDYRNSFKHETCLKLIPILENNVFHLYISKGDSFGIEIIDILRKLPVQLRDYIMFYIENAKGKL